MSDSDDANAVLVQPLRFFRGEPGEGDGGDGHVAPHHKPFRVSRQRFSELRANELVEEHKAPAEDARADIGSEEDKRDVDARPGRGRNSRIA